MFIDLDSDDLLGVYEYLWYVRVERSSGSAEKSGFRKRRTGPSIEHLTDFYAESQKKSKSTISVNISFVKRRRP